MTPQDLIDTEEEIRQLWEAGELPYLTHLAGSVDGKYEEWLCDFFRANIKPTDWVLASHRCHFHWLLHHWKSDYTSLPELLVTALDVASSKVELISRTKAGKSMFLYGPRFLCSAIVAGTASIAAGLALSIQRRGGSERVFCFVGDGASEHGHFLESMAFTHSKKLPLQFIIEDNGSSCGVSKAQRRGSDDEIAWSPCVTKICYTPKFPHAGSSVRPQLKYSSAKL